MRAIAAIVRITLSMAFAAALLAGCLAYIAPPVPTAVTPAGFPAFEYDRAAAGGAPVYRIDAATSSVVIDVRRAGSLARLGHDHVVAGYDVHGFLRTDDARADLYIALDKLVVDEPRLRAIAGFDTTPSAEAIEGTRRNMLGRVLEADRFPFAIVAARGLDEHHVASVSLTLHGVTRTMPITLDVSVADSEASVAGAFTLRQTDFGIVPLSLLGGAIEVQDAVDIRFRLRAVRGAH